ncbi:hypothetical protein E3O10_01320 [Cryobacterium luteum]|uniref:2OG-Fe(II) oxygenase n=2 Tax=Cryobacterium luteum TaxID=1424661 RepID=A0A5F0DDV2_9MICO|nr:hypothetical protein E3O10_01320 [Cryobacterium luteum]
MSIAARLVELHRNATTAERANLKLILGLSAGNLVPSSDSLAAESRRAVSETLELLCPYDVPDPRGLQYRGRPDFLTDDLFDRLLQESISKREIAIPFDEHYLGAGGLVADDVALSAELAALVESVVPGAESTGIASYLFYKDEGQGIDPHIDTDIFSLNILMMLQHRLPGTEVEPSALYMHYPDGSEERLQLQPGEVVIFLAGTQAHSRTRIGADESVSILTFGFMPKGAPIENYRR